MSKLPNRPEKGTALSSPFIPHPVHQSTRSYLTTREAATYLGFAQITMAMWRSARTGPQFIRVGRQIRYRRSDLDDFMAGHTVGTRGQLHVVPDSCRGLIRQMESREEPDDIFL